MGHMSHTPSFGSPRNAADGRPDMDPRGARQPADSGDQPRDPPVSASAPEPRVLFVCIHNAGRSIVAAALLNARKPAGVQADSAGTDPADTLNSTVVAVLAERGISLAGVSPKPITSDLLATTDLVITMSRHPTGPTLPRGVARHQHWQLGFPGDDLDGMRAFCDRVDQQVTTLLASLRAPTG